MPVLLSLSISRFLIKNGNVYTANIENISFNCAHLVVGKFDVANVFDFVCFKFVPLTLTGLASSGGIEQEILEL